jgi:hypothetical protein
MPVVFSKHTYIHTIFRFKIAIAKLKNLKLPASKKIPAELNPPGDEILVPVEESRLL